MIARCYLHSLRRLDNRTRVKPNEQTLIPNPLLEECPVLLPQRKQKQKRIGHLETAVVQPRTRGVFLTPRSVLPRYVSDESLLTKTTGTAIAKVFIAVSQRLSAVENGMLYHYQRSSVSILETNPPVSVSIGFSSIFAKSLSQCREH